MKLNREQTYKFSEILQDYSVLYNIRDKNYSNKVIKEAAYKQFNEVCERNDKRVAINWHDAKTISLDILTTWITKTVTTNSIT